MAQVTSFNQNLFRNILKEHFTLAVKYKCFRAPRNFSDDNSDEKPSYIEYHYKLQKFSSGECVVCCLCRSTIGDPLREIAECSSVDLFEVTDVIFKGDKRIEIENVMVYPYTYDLRKSPKKEWIKNTLEIIGRLESNYPSDNIKEHISEGGSPIFSKINKNITLQNNNKINELLTPRGEEA
jgi:hypothetical protein